MREGIHPNYYQATVTCNCGNTFVTGSTISMTISPSITPANCFDRRSDAAVPTSVTPIRLIASRKMISLKL